MSIERGLFLQKQRKPAKMPFARQATRPLHGLNGSTLARGATAMVASETTQTVSPSSAAGKILDPGVNRSIKAAIGIHRRTFV